MSDRKWSTCILAMMIAVVILEPDSLLAAEAPTGVAEELQLLKEETIVTAARHEQPISQAPSNVYVITDEDIRQSGATDIPTVLRRISGMEVMQTTGADFNVSIRGDNQLSANKLLVLVDGRSIYIDPAGSVYWKLLPITLPEIKRIEVLKGPSSSIYGFNAFDGVINIITKSPEEMKGTTLQFGGGEFGTISSAAIQAGTLGNFGYRVSLGRDQNQQWRNSEALAFRDHKFNVQTQYALSDESKFSVSGGLVDANRFDGGISDVGFSAGTPAQSYAHIVYERPNLFVRAFWNSFSDTSQGMTIPLLADILQFTDQNGNSRDNITANTYNIEGQHTIGLGSSHEFIYGVNYRYNTVTSNFLSQLSRENRLGFYAQEQWKARPSLTAVAGLRYDLDTFIHPTVSPRIALIYKPSDNHTLRAALSTAYRPPNAFERYLSIRTEVTIPPPIGPFTGEFVTVGATRLSPEQIISYELSYQGWYLRHRLRVRTDLFFNHLSDLIAFHGATGINEPATAINGGEADIYGGEAGIEFLATSWLTGFANYAYQELGQTFIGNSRRGAPRFKVNAGLRGEWANGLSGEVLVHHVGATTFAIEQDTFTDLGVMPPNARVGSYTLLNVRAAYHFWKEKAEVAVSVFNALNDRHQEHFLGDTIGSRVMGWLTMRF